MTKRVLVPDSLPPPPFTGSFQVLFVFFSAVKDFVSLFVFELFSVGKMLQKRLLSPSSFNAALLRVRERSEHAIF